MTTIALIVAGCATVDPKPDFNKTTCLISEHTGVNEVYSPDVDDLVAEKVNRLLADGLTTNEAVQVALLNNRNFQSLFQEIGASRADVVQSELLSNPSLFFGIRLPEGGGRLELTLGLAQQLIDLWQIPIRKQIATSQLEQTILQVAHRATELSAEVQKKCYAVLALRQIEAVTVEDRELLNQTLELVQKQVDAGESNPLDANLVRVAVMEVDRELITVKRDRHTAEVELARYLGLSRWATPWELSDTMPSPAMPVEDEADLLVYAMTERLDAKMVAQAVDTAEQALQQEYIQVFPNVTVGLNAERTERRAVPGRKILADAVRESITNGQPTIPSIETKAERRLARRQFIDMLLGPSIDVTLPIWDQNQAQIAKAHFKAVQARRMYEDVLDAIAQQVQQAATAARENAKLVRFYEQEMLPQAKENVEGARRIYELGEQNILVLIDAQRSLIQQRAAYVGALRDYAGAITELKQALGGRLLSALTTQPASSRPNL